MNSFKLWIYNIITRWLPESRCFRFKSTLLSWVGAHLGNNVRIYSSAHILGTGTLEIGDDVHIGPGARICVSGTSQIKIGSHVDIAPEVMLVTGSHEIDLIGEHIGGRGCSKSIAVGSGSWLGARSIILPGVNLPNRTIVAAGAVVTKSFEREKTLIAGVPAAVKREM